MGVVVTTETTEAVITFDPFRIDVSVNGEIAAVINSRGLLNIEHYRAKRLVLLTPPTDSTH